MSSLPKCLLCQGAPFKMLAHGTVIHPTDKSRPCALNGIEVTQEQWTALMGRGEPVAWAATDETGLIVESLGFNKSRRFDTPLYLAPQKVQSIGSTDAVGMVDIVDTGHGKHAIYTNLDPSFDLPFGRHKLYTQAPAVSGEPVAWLEEYEDESFVHWRDKSPDIVAHIERHQTKDHFVTLWPLHKGTAPAVGGAVLLDAERYRWLREQHWSKSRVVAVIDPKTSVRLGQYCPSLDLLDLEIDTAMNKGEG